MVNENIFQKTQIQVNEFADEGLRTLMLAQRIIPELEFQIWFDEAKKARLAIKDREKLVAEVDEKIEVELELIGSTAIEDRL